MTPASYVKSHLRRRRQEPHPLRHPRDAGARGGPRLHGREHPSGRDGRPPRDRGAERRHAAHGQSARSRSPSAAAEAERCQTATMSGCGCRRRSRPATSSRCARSCIHPMERIERDAAGQDHSEELQLRQQGDRDLPGQDHPDLRHDAERERESVLLLHRQGHRSRARSRSTFLDTTGGRFETHGQTSRSREPDRVSRPSRTAGDALGRAGRAAAPPAPGRPPTRPTTHARPGVDARAPFPRRAASSSVLPDGKRMAVRYAGWSTRDSQLPDLRLRRHGGPSRRCRRCDAGRRGGRPATGLRAVSQPRQGAVHRLPSDSGRRRVAGRQRRSRPVHHRRPEADRRSISISSIWDPRVFFPQHVDAAVGHRQAS